MIAVICITDLFVVDGFAEMQFLNSTDNVTAQKVAYCDCGSIYMRSVGDVTQTPQTISNAGLYMEASVMYWVDAKYW